MGKISDHDMFNTFNMGVGMCVVVKKEDCKKALEILKSEEAYYLGEIVKGDKEVILC